MVTCVINRQIYSTAFVTTRYGLTLIYSLLGVMPFQFLYDDSRHHSLVSPS